MINSFFKKKAATATTLSKRQELKQRKYDSDRQLWVNGEASLVLIHLTNGKDKEEYKSQRSHPPILQSIAAHIHSPPQMSVSLSLLRTPMLTKKDMLLRELPLLIPSAHLTLRSSVSLYSVILLPVLHRSKAHLRTPYLKNETISWGCRAASTDFRHGWHLNYRLYVN